MDALGKLATASLKPQGEEATSRKKALDTAQQFEQVLVRQLVGSLRATSKLGGEEGGMFGSEPGSDTYADWFDEHVAKDISEHGRIGVAEALVEEFERMKRAKKPGDKSLDEVDATQLHKQPLPPRMQGALDGLR